MARRQYTVANLVSEIRQQIDEQNVDSVDTTLDILPSLNRALDYGVSVLSHAYVDPFITETVIPLTSGVANYAIPEDCFEDRLLKVVIVIGADSNGNGIEHEVTRMSYYDAAKYKSRNLNAIPYLYYVKGRDIIFVNSPTSTYPAKITYVRQPEQLVLPQGRITAISVPSNFLVVDSVGADLTTESDQLESYINVIDSRSGLIKWTGQIQVLDDNKITIRTSPQRDVVLGRDIEDALPAPDATIQVELDDFVCTVYGTCIPYFQQPLSNFLIQYAVAEITRKLGGEAPTEEQILQKFEKQLEHAWSGRENTKRIKNRSRAWSNRRVRTLYGRYS